MGGLFAGIFGFFVFGCFFVGVTGLYDHGANVLSIVLISIWPVCVIGLILYARRKKRSQ